MADSPRHPGDEPHSAGFGRVVPPEGSDWALLVPLFVHALAAQMLLSMVRVTTTYRAVELGLSEAWLGVIASVYALLPIFLAVSAGRFIDRGNDAISAWIGSGVVALACVGLWLLNGTTLGLMASTALLGTGQLYLMVSYQILCVRGSSVATRETVFGNYMVANAFGQGLGPLVVGWLGGSAKIPPTGLLFAISLATSIAMVALAFMIRPSPGPRVQKARAELTPVLSILRVPGLPTVMIASIIIVAAQDLIVIYLPLLGAERGIDVAHVGMLLMARSGSAVVSRIFYARIMRVVGRVPLTVSTMIVAAVSYLVIALPVPLWGLYLAISVSGFALGLAATLSISNVVDLAPAHAQGIAVSMRISGNRIGQVTMPLMAGIVAAAAGAASIFVIIALFLAASGTSVQIVRGNARR
jgi:predicted MFS family arabinose efflux permease